MTDDAQRLKEALGRLGITLDEPATRQGDVFALLAEAGKQYAPASQREHEYRQMYADLRRLEEQTEAVARQIEALRTKHSGRPLRGGGPSRLVDLREPAVHTPPRRQAGDVELNETTAQHQLIASLARLGIHIQPGEEEETL
jgi:hypothetical protein